MSALNETRQLLTAAAIREDCATVQQIVDEHPDISKFPALFEAVKSGSQGCVDILLRSQTPEDVTSVYDEGGLLLYAALEFHNWDLFHMLFPLVDPKQLEDGVFYSAIRSRCTPCFTQLEPYLPEHLENAVLRAVDCGHVAILEPLLHKYSLSSYDPLFKAICCNQSIVEMMIPHCTPEMLQKGLCDAALHKPALLERFMAVCDPKSNGNKALKEALVYGIWESASILCPVCDTGAVLEWLTRSRAPDPTAIGWLERWIAQDLNTRLHDTIDTVASAKTVRKM